MLSEVAKTIYAAPPSTKQVMPLSASLVWRIVFHTRLLTQHKSRSFRRDHFLHVETEFAQTWFHVDGSDSSIASLIASATPSGLIENASMAFESLTTVGFFSPSIR